MAGNGKESRDLDLEEKAPPAETSSEETVSRPQRERRPPGSSKPRSLPHHSQAAQPPPPPDAADVQVDDWKDPDQQLEEKEDTAAEEGEVEEEEEMAAEEVEVEEEVTHNYVQPESAVGEQPVLQPALQPAPRPALMSASAPPHLGEVRPSRSRGKSDKCEPLPRSKKALSSTYTYASGSSRNSRRSQQVELTPLQAAMIEERRKLGELQEIQSQIQEEQALDERAQELDRRAQEALKERERLTWSLTLQRRLRKVQRELEEARLITSFTGDVGMTTEQPPAPPAISSVNDPPQVLAPFSMSSRVLDSAEPVDLFSEQQAPLAGPQISASYSVPVNQRTPSLFQHLPPAVSLPVDAVSPAVTPHPTTESHPVV
ncbi:hypothetical protein ABVT39_016268 [Epinephelus coioides]